MNQISSDLIFFGYGRITDYLMNHFLKNGKSVICVTNQPMSSSESANLRFFSRKELIQNKVVSDFAVFSWRDSTALSVDVSEWLLNNLLGIQKSFFLSSASVYMSSEKLIDENPSNLSSDHLANTTLV